MRAYRIAAEGAAPAFADIPTPVPGAGEVRVRIAAAALNFADLLMIAGRYQAMPPPPFTLGLEAAGVVEACGPGVAHLRPGTRVAVFAGHGALAEA
ncbi:MAG: alcohol dehydrogenase catalytic domain-containing protein, partial [Rhodobacteraceae bacterium]|nr:alcohol dehydrogenase catalytic domain-containing protein [Paracoccaceae bacterium]